ncbi:hypothetical protein P7C70_g4971, partial [Phenoliferia sp. Uapishka_3]
MAPQAMGEHPDGDPFAEQDKAREAQTPLGRMEARAKLETAAREAAEKGLPPPPSPILPPQLRTSQRSINSLYGTPKTGTPKPLPPAVATAKVETVVLADTSDEEDAAAVQNHIVQPRAGSIVANTPVKVEASLDAVMRDVPVSGESSADEVAARTPGPASTPPPAPESLHENA